jgi:hypothetical protein
MAGLMDKESCNTTHAFSVLMASQLDMKLQVEVEFAGNRYAVPREQSVLPAVENVHLRWPHIFGSNSDR